MRCTLALSRQSAAPRPQDRAGRLQVSDLASALQWLGGIAAQSSTAYLCGSNAFVEAVTAMLRDLQVPDGAIRTERFGG
jgi:ferredoxin-NADP reductase